ncbi:MAG: valine--tRNA ligase, partial [Candidatus Andersenbacteria bacterium]|nr:valine--tRNA ligase [Candidatus Andersenbacteria bacterium]
EIPKAYEPKEVEESILAKWAKADIGNPDRLNPDGKPFAMVFPPANVTGVLHLGHALTTAIEDTLVRFRRMQGYKTLYVPGTDHAAIATQAKVEAELYKKAKKSRRDFSDEAFLQLVKDFALSSQSTILGQLKRLGASVDWGRLAYTMDERRSLAVRTAFKQLYDMGLVYRGHRLVNWDPKLQTNVSDEEVEWKEETASLYYLKYGPFTIATARPETKVGDKYVVMHPADQRYAQYKDGDTFTAEWINGAVTATIIKDESVDPAFGTGVMTITPAHDAADYAIATKHNLDIKPMIDLKGLLMPEAGALAGVHIKKARPLIIEKLQAKGLIEKIDAKYVHRIAANSRGGGLIEPQVREQWFIAVDKEFTLPHSGIEGIASGATVTLKQLMREAVGSGQIKIIPQYFDKTYFHWVDNLHDWCISRQIIFGHRIPVWYKADETYCGIEAPSGEGWQQDPDTLDTWFSSGLWSFSSLGWPAKTDDLKTFHPLAVLETGYDILPFWILRMVLFSTALLGQVPFKTVYLHGLVRDERKQKMSKSKGNAVDPLDVLTMYGTDALRLALMYGSAGGTDMAYSPDRVKGMKHFANKLWNIMRFILSNIEGPFPDIQIPPQAVTQADRDIVQKLEAVTGEVTSQLEAFQFHEAAQAIYQFTWHELADVYIEASKAQLKDEMQKATTQHILAWCLVITLKLLHPFMPFVTERIWGILYPGKVLALESWPQNAGRGVQK